MTLDRKKRSIRQQRSKRRRTNARRRGAAMVEALVVLPVFVLLFVGILYLKDLWLQAQQVDQQARTCAFLYSQSGCQEDQLPRACRGVVHVGDLPEGNPQSVEQEMKAIGREASSAGDARGVVETVVAEVLSGAIAAAFAKTGVAETEGAVDKPSLLGGEQAFVHRKVHLACNLVPRERQTLAEEIWDIVAN